MRILCALLLGLAACAAESPIELLLEGGSTPGSSGLVLGVDGDGAVRFVRRIDGTIVPQPRRVAVTADRPQFLLATTKDSGEDQSKVIVLDEDGRLAAEYRVSGVSPYPHFRPRAEGDRLRQLQAPVRNQVVPFTWRGRRLLALCTRDSYAPSSLVLLEATAPDRFEERLVFWNFGHIHHLVEKAPYVVILGFANQLGAGHPGYPPFAAVFHLDDLAWTGEDKRRTGHSPRPADAAGGPYRHYVRFATDADVHWTSATIRNGRLTAQVTYGLVYHVDLETGAVETDASEGYRADFPRRRRDDPELPALEEHLENLRQAARVWSRER